MTLVTETLGRRLTHNIPCCGGSEWRHVCGGSSTSLSAAALTSARTSSRTATNTSAPARTRTRSLHVLHRIVTQERCYCAHNTARAAPAALRPSCATARIRRLFPSAGPHTPRQTPAVALEHARCAFFLFEVPTLFSAGRFPFLLAAHCANE